MAQLQPDRTEIDTIDGEQTMLQLYFTDPDPDTDFEGRIRVKRSGRWWEIGVGDDHDGEIVERPDGAMETPEWLRESLHGIGIEDIDS